jgi:hypothetical protein
MDLGHSVEPRAVGDAGVAPLVALPLKQTAVRGRLCRLLMGQAAAVIRFAMRRPS